MHHHDETYTEDRKKFRKVRKYLRQIEHLQLVTRDLTHDEKLKVKKKPFYREQLKHFTAKYKNDESFFETALNESTQSQHVNDVSATSQAVQEDVELAKQKLESAIDELSEVLDKVSLKEEESGDENQDTNIKVREENTIVKDITESSPAKELVEEVPFAQLKSEKTKDKKKPKAEKPEASKPTDSEIKVELDNHKPKVVVTKAKEEKAKVKALPPKPKVFYKTYDMNDAHEDLIVSIDLCVQSNLIVTGSRDTTLKVWSIENPKNIKLLHSFGGHSSAITFVKFWPRKQFITCLENLCKQSETESLNQSSIAPDDAEAMLDTVIGKECDLPIVVSSSLDQTIRIWHLTEDRCILLRELYLYNPVYHFQIHETAFVIGLGGGKLQYWNNLTQIVSFKCFEDVDSVCCVKFGLKGDSRIMALSQSGWLKVFDVNEFDPKPNFDLVAESDVFSHLSVSHLIKRNFKCFELINDEQFLLINDNQSFVIFHDIKKKQCMLIPTNTNNYGFTNCFFKLNNLFLISAYNIDDATSNINVFCHQNEITNPKSQISYQYTMETEGNLEDCCISTLNCSAKLNAKNKADMYMVSGSSRNFKLWSIDSGLNVPQSYFEAKTIKLCKQAGFHVESNDEDETDSEEEDGSGEEELIEEETETKGSRCNIQ